MERSTVLNALISGKEKKRYLEIGVQNGFTFENINATRKVAVDPAFLFDVAGAKSGAPESDVSYHEMLSDVYFSEVARPDDLFDVVFIDGLHTFEQTLRDLMNAILYIPHDGIIVVDDVLPNSYAASLTKNHDMIALNQALGDPSMAWMGDVYRLVFFIRNFMPGFSYATVSENHGQAILWREARNVPASTSLLRDIVGLEYLDTVTRRDEFNVAPIDTILTHLRQRGLLT